MKTYRFYTNQKDISAGDKVTFDQFEAGHARNSLRLKKGDSIVGFNGAVEFVAEIMELTKKEFNASVKNITRTADEKDSPKINLFMSLIKTKNFELVLEKATELGVSSITPVETDFSVLKAKDTAKKRERWKRIIITAAKQSERIGIPELRDAVRFSEISELPQVKDGLNLFMTIERPEGEVGPAYRTGRQPRLLDKLDAKNTTNIFIGPEGGFSETEEKIAKENSFEFMQLSKNILRAETAAIVAVGMVNYISTYIPFQESKSIF